MGYDLQGVRYGPPLLPVPKTLKTLESQPPNKKYHYYDKKEITQVWAKPADKLVYGGYDV